MESTTIVVPITLHRAISVVHGMANQHARTPMRFLTVQRCTYLDTLEWRCQQSALSERAVLLVFSLLPPALVGHVCAAFQRRAQQLGVAMIFTVWCIPPGLHVLTLAHLPCSADVRQLHRRWWQHVHDGCRSTRCSNALPPGPHRVRICEPPVLPRSCSAHHRQTHQVTPCCHQLLWYFVSIIHLHPSPYLLPRSGET